MSRALREQLYREHLESLERAERTRSWSVFRDIDWSAAAGAPRDPELALSAETFCGIEMFLPDYLSRGVELWRDSFGQALFSAQWGFEESKHSIALREYLVRAGHRTADQMIDFEELIAGRSWQLPFDCPRKMVAYGALQEMTTFVNYLKHAEHAERGGDVLLASIYKRIARDEIAHCRFHERVLGLLLAEDRERTLHDLAFVFRHFRMPAQDLLPDYERRREVFVKAGIDRKVFLNEVWTPILKRLGLHRRDLPLLPAEARSVREAQGSS